MGLCDPNSVSGLLWLLQPEISSGGYDGPYHNLLSLTQSKDDGPYHNLLSLTQSKDDGPYHNLLSLTQSKVLYQSILIVIFETYGYRKASILDLFFQPYYLKIIYIALKLTIKQYIFNEHFVVNY